MASRACKPGEYFRRSVVAKSCEQSLKQSEDNSVDISRKDLDDHEPESTRESRSTPKDVEEGLPHEKVEKSKKSEGKRKSSFASESAAKGPNKWSEAVEILQTQVRV